MVNANSRGLTPHRRTIPDANYFGALAGQWNFNLDCILFDWHTINSDILRDGFTHRRAALHVEPT
jgi:hypothetical protein